MARVDRGTMIRYATVQRVVLPLFRRKLRSVTGRAHLPGHGPFVLAANHIDFLDGFFIAAAIEANAKRPLALLTKTGNYWWTGATIPIDRNDRAASLAAAERHLRRGGTILNFVEGVRNSGTSVSFGRTGTARLAIAAGVPVVPVGISGFAGRSMLASLTKFLALPRTVTVRIGEPLIPPAVSPEDRDAVAAFTRTILDAVAPLAGKTGPG